jgi:hypothetical protein
MLLDYWEKRALTANNCRQELAGMGAAANDTMEVVARIIAAQGEAVVSCYRFQAPTGEPGTIVVCHDLGRGVISLGTSRQWGQWDEAYEVLTLDGSGEKYSFEGCLVCEGDDGSCSLGNF